MDKYQQWILNFVKCIISGLYPDGHMVFSFLQPNECGILLLMNILILNNFVLIKWYVLDCPRVLFFSTYSDRKSTPSEKVHLCDSLIKG